MKKEVPSAGPFKAQTLDPSLPLSQDSIPSGGAIVQRDQQFDGQSGRPGSHISFSSESDADATADLPWR